MWRLIISFGDSPVFINRVSAAILDFAVNVLFWIWFYLKIKKEKKKVSHFEKKPQKQWRWRWIPERPSPFLEQKSGEVGGGQAAAAAVREYQRQFYVNYEPQTPIFPASALAGSDVLTATLRSQHLTPPPQPAPGAPSAAACPPRP